ncbi:MAG: cytidine deaminase [Bacteroidales bacterium]|nr:cytidine deaminase [Bacteroidales bacterium]
MKEHKIEIPVKVYAYEELSLNDRTLVDKAKEMTYQSYAPYSHFSVGAAALLDNKVIITGSNQENAAYPSGICAERTTLFYAQAQYPDAAVQTLAIAARNESGDFTKSPCSPCGACRQVMLESQVRGGIPMRVLLYGSDYIYELACVEDLLPLCFTSADMKAEE